MGRPLTIAVPKGRILKQLCGLLERAGYDPAALRADDRRLVREDPAAIRTEAVERVRDAVGREALISLGNLGF